MLDKSRNSVYSEFQGKLEFFAQSKVNSTLNLPRVANSYEDLQLSDFNSLLEPVFYDAFRFRDYKFPAFLPIYTLFPDSRECGA